MPFCVSALSFRWRCAKTERKNQTIANFSTESSSKWWLSESRVHHHHHHHHHYHHHYLWNCSMYFGLKIGMFCVNFAGRKTQYFFYDYFNQRKRCRITNRKHIQSARQKTKAITSIGWMGFVQECSFESNRMKRNRMRGPLVWNIEFSFEMKSA